MSRDPFYENFLAAMVALRDLEHALMMIGMSGEPNMRMLQSSVIQHGAKTYEDIHLYKDDNNDS